MTIWTAWEAPRRHQGGRKGAFGRRLGGTREAPGRQERTIWTACKTGRRLGAQCTVHSRHVNYIFIYRFLYETFQVARHTISRGNEQLLEENERISMENERK